ncbi:MAG TPA: DUF1223 domain-containing protein [Acidobacteriaceae bacterium]|jgi:hypothetical protein|nr:DUF1223 domain-containing protein [Acidobacteriaceae bacterium]
MAETRTIFAQRGAAWKLAAAGLLLIPALVLALIVALIVPMFGAGSPAMAASNSGRTPILMELFTSEGCSSCPPVDNWVARIDAAQPVAGAEIIVLSEHVDYWDHDGWKDPFSSEAITDRQKAYVHNLGLSDVYTPQIIVDGDAELKPADAQQTAQGLQRAAGAPTIPVRIDSVAVGAGSPAVLTGRIEADGGAQKKNADVFVAVALDKTLTDVLAGENDGKKLENIAVVKEMVKVGKLEKGKSFDQPFSVKLWPDADPANLRVVAFVQESGPGKVLGAGMTKEIARGQ